MSTYYCYRCASTNSLIPSLPTSNFTATQYQVGKFTKHTVPTNRPGITGVFADSTYSAYERYVISSAASGCVEVDDSGRTNLIYYAGNTIGASFRDGKAALPNDAVKLVLLHEADRLHAFSIASTGISSRTCNICGGAVIA